MKVFLILCLFTFLFSSCAPKKIKPTRSPGELYVEGVRLMEEKKYDRAIRNFSTIRDEFPFDPVAPYAMAKMADCYFFKRDYSAASKIYEEFISSYPNDVNIPYVLFRCGESYERMSLSKDRDQEHTYKAIEKYTSLINRFPTSEYANKAMEKKRLMEQKLAERELYVAEFYLKTYEYNASILRLNYLLEHFPHAKGIDKALFLLSRAYEALGDFEKSQYFFERLKREYPQSPYSRYRGFEGKKAEAKTYVERREEEKKWEKKERILPPYIEEERVSHREKFALFDAKKGVDVYADRMEGFERERRIFFEGSVVLKQEDLTIVSDTLEAYLSEDKKEIEKVYARGNVRIIKGEKTATCREAEFDNRSGKILLRGEVEVISGSDRLKGDRIVYDLNEESVSVEGDKDKRAKVTISPKP